MKNLKFRSYIFLGAIVYMSVITFSYIYIVAPMFNYLGYRYVAPDFKFIITTGLFAVVPLTWIPLNILRPSQLVYWLLYLLAFVPASIIPVLSLDIQIGKIILFDFVLLLSFGLLKLFHNLPLIKIPSIKITKEVFWFIISVVSLPLYVIIIINYGFKLNVVSFSEVYEVRSLYTDSILEGGKLVAYSVAWIGNVINPLLISDGLLRRKLTVIALGVFGQLMIFSITGLKSVFLSAAFILIVLVLLKLNKSTFGLWVTWGATLMVIFSTVMYYLFNSFSMFSLFVRRLIIIPGILTGYFFQFFSENPKALLGHSIFNGITEYPYSLDPPKLIGLEYFGRSSFHANANVWADAFCNFGYIGIVTFTIWLGLVFWFFDSLSRNKDQTMASLMLAIPSISFSNSAFLTTILTHGVGLVTLIIYFLPTSDKVERVSTNNYFVLNED